MKDITITCPKCGNEFPLSEGVIDHIRKDISVEIESKITNQIKNENASIILDLEDQLKTQSNQLNEFRTIEKDLRKKNRELEEREKNIDIEIMRQVDAEKAVIKEEVIKQSNEEYRLREKEKDKQIEDFKKKVDELNRKLEQNSQQLIGEVAEIELEEELNRLFPFDEIAPVGKGKSGADVIQRVFNRRNQFCGTIVWESKNTKTWNENWINKLKEDLRREKGDIPIIVSTALPQDIKSFGSHDGIWITNFKLVREVALILRQHLIELQELKQAQSGIGEKADLLFNYLCGNEFKQRIISMVESFSEMQSDLARERQAMEQIWSKREKQINKFVRNISGMYGDVRGIIGGALPEIEPLELPLLNEGE